MVLSNSSKRARYASSIMNQSSGGGCKKAGLRSSVGRDSWSNIAYGKGCSAVNMAFTVNSNVSISRPTGGVTNISYWSFV